jgi:hypothetical protein
MTIRYTLPSSSGMGCSVLPTKLGQVPPLGASSPWTNRPGQLVRAQLKAIIEHQ